jgi:hypothetical protein
MKRMMKAAVALMLTFGVSGCATIFKGNTSMVAVQSEPMGAEVYVNGQRLGMTPVSLRLASNQYYSVEFRKEGYETRTITLTKTIGVQWIILDVLLGVVPLVVDAATGNWYEFEPQPFNGVLRPTGSTPPGSPAPSSSDPAKVL